MTEQTPESNEHTAPISATEQTRTLPPDPALSGLVPPAAGGVPAGQRFRDRLWSLRAVLAVAVASVLLGGAGGAAIAKATDDSGNGGRFVPGHGRFGPGAGPGQFGRGGSHFRGPGRLGGPSVQQPGQGAPTAPQAPGTTS